VQDRSYGTLDRALDHYIGALAREGRTEATRRKYRQVLEPFTRLYPEHAPAEISEADCERYLNRWVNCAPATVALYVSILRSFFAFLEGKGVVQLNPAAKIKRPALKRPEELDVVETKQAEVQKLYAAAEEWDEVICLALLTGLGPRRNAAALARRSDVDFERGTIRLHEKGGKVIVKPLPNELAAILQAAEAAGVWTSEREYLIPNRRETRREGERSNKVVYAIVKRLAERAGVETHPHSLRAAFAVRFDEQVADVMALKDLLGHTRLETTQVYLRRRDRARGMEKVRGLNWSSVFPPDGHMPPTGFEPVLPQDALGQPLRQKLEQLEVRSRKGARV